MGFWELSFKRKQDRESSDVAEAARLLQSAGIELRDRLGTCWRDEWAVEEVVDESEDESEEDDTEGELEQELEDLVEDSRVLDIDFHRKVSSE